MSYITRIVFFTIIILSSPLTALDYLDFSNTTLNIRGESCTFKDDIVISKKNNSIEYIISGKNKQFNLDLDENNGERVVIADISGNGYCDLLGVMTGSSQVNEYYDFFIYSHKNKIFNKIKVEASDPSIDNIEHKIVSKYRSGPRWWRDAYCQKNNFKKCEVGFWFFDNVFVVKDLFTKKIFFINNNDEIIKSPKVTLTNATSSTKIGERGRILDIRIEEEIFLEVQFNKEKLWVNINDIEAKLIDYISKEVREKSYLYKSPNKPTKCT